MSQRSISPEIYSEDSETPMDFSDLSTPALRSNLSNVSEFMDRLGTNEEAARESTASKQKTHVQRTEQIEDFIRNYLLKRRFTKTFNSFQEEWYEVQELQKNANQDVFDLPDIFIKNQKLEEEIVRIQQELDETKINANKIKLTWEKLKKQKDYHQIHHSRLIQENDRLNKQIEKLRSFHLLYEQNY